MGRCETRETLENSMRWLLARPLPASLSMRNSEELRTVEVFEVFEVFGNVLLCSHRSQVGLLLAPSPAGAASKKEKETIKTAAQQMHGLQDRWAQIASKGPDGAKEILEAFSGVSYSTFVIKVPAGQSVGVDIEDRTITSVSSRKLGWSTGDTIQEINGIEAKDEEMVVNSVKAAKNQGQDLVFKVQRLSESPWVSLDRALTNVYADIDAEVVLPEPDQVSDMFRDLKNNVNLAKDDIIDMATVKEKLDAFIKALDQFASS